MALGKLPVTKLGDNTVEKYGQGNLFITFFLCMFYGYSDTKIVLPVFSHAAQQVF